MHDDAQRSAKVEAAALHAPARDERRGGDFHLLHQAGTLTMAVVGDVTGKGEDAAPYAQRAERWAAADAVAAGGDPAALLEALNERIYETDGFPLVAAAALAIDAEQWSASWAYAAHLPPVALDTGVPFDGANTGVLLGY